MATGWVLAALGFGGSAVARGPLVDGSAVAPRVEGGTVALSSLPAQAQQTYRLIREGGPFASAKDGSVFGNFERALPRQPRGYYHEYTVPTPGARNRGARRIVCGGNPPVQPAACYYTGDHYAHFEQIAP